MRDNVLVIMAKQPVPGAVKTRLARQLGDERACDLYRAFLADIRTRFAAGPRKLVWAVHPPGADLAAIVGTDAVCIDQRGEDLGERMRRCFEALFAAGAARVVMLGADAPHVPEATLAQSFAALSEHDVSLVPTRDGGYCAIGLRQPRDLFSGIAMSTPTVFAETRARIDSLGLSAAILEASFDIDEVEDLRQLEKLLHAGAVRLPHTERALRAGRP